MENLTTEQFFLLASKGFCCGFAVGFGLWGLRCAFRFLSISLTGRSSLGGVD